MSVQYQYDFYAFPATVRNQLRKSIASDDYLIYADVQSNLSLFFVSGVMAFFCVFVLYAVVIANFGDPLQDRLWTAKGLLVVYAILIFGIVCALHALRQRFSLNKKYRFLPGRYVFPFALVDLRGSKITVYDLTQLRKLDVVHRYANGKYNKTVCNFNLKDGSCQTITIANMGKAEEMLARFNQSQAAARRAFDQRDVTALYGYDPFLDVRKNQWRGADQAGDSWLERIGAALSATAYPVLTGTAIILAAVFWCARTAASDYQMHRVALEAKTEAAYLGYIENGYFYVKEMRAGLPRVVFNETRQKQSVSLLRALKKRFPGSDIQADIPKEIHQLYQKAWKKFETQAVSTDTRLISTMQQLLNYAQEHDDPQVSIKFTRPTPDDLSHMDAFLKSREIKGINIALAARHFGNDSASVREARITGSLRSAFNSIFPNDVLVFSVGSDKNRERPMLNIKYQIEPSGSIYFSEKKKDDAFVGLVIRFRAEIVVPNVEERWKFDLEVEPPQRFQVEYKTSADSAGEARPSDGQVYAVMAGRAFDHLGGKITAAFFKPDSAVFIRQMKRGK